MIELVAVNFGPDCGTGGGERPFCFLCHPEDTVRLRPKGFLWGTHDDLNIHTSTPWRHDYRC